MEEIIKLMKDYAKRHKISNGITLILEDDKSGIILPYASVYDVTKQLFTFDNIEDLEEKLKE